MKKQVAEAIKSQTLKDTLITLIGSGIGSLFSILFYIIVARNLKPQDFGYLSLMWSVIILIMDMFDLPINNSLVRFASHYRQKKDYQSLSVLVRLVIKLKIATSIVIAVIFIVFAKPLSGLVFKTETLAPLFIISGILYSSMPFFRFSSNLFLAWQRFASQAFLIIAGDSLRLIITLLIVLAGILSLPVAISVSFIAYLIIFVLSLFFLPKQIYLKLRAGKSIKGFWHFSRFMTLALIIASVHSRLDQFFLARLSTPLQLGFYAASVRITVYIQQLSGTLSSVLAPKFAARSREAVGKFFIKTLILALIVSVSLLIFIPVAPGLIRLTFGKNYLGSISAFQILLLANALFLMTVPFSSIITYYFSAVRFLVGLSFLQLGTQITANYLLVPSFGAAGSAYAWLATNSLSLFAMSIFVVYQFKKNAYSPRHR